MHKQRKSRRDSGFTLIEILITVALVAVLSVLSYYLTGSEQLDDAEITVARSILFTQVPQAVARHHIQHDGIEANFEIAGAGNNDPLPEFPGGTATVTVDATDNEVEIQLSQTDFDADTVNRILDGLTDMDIVKSVTSGNRTVVYGL